METMAKAHVSLNSVVKKTSSSRNFHHFYIYSALYVWLICLERIVLSSHYLFPVGSVELSDVTLSRVPVKLLIQHCYHA